MAGARQPGYLCMLADALHIDTGTMCVAASLPPGPTTGGPRGPKVAPQATGKPVGHVPATPAAAVKGEQPAIEKRVAAFASDLTDAVAALFDARRALQAKQAAAVVPGGRAPVFPAIPTVVFSLSLGKGSIARTPAEQAEQVANGHSWVCWGGHMTDKARHVAMKVNGKISWDPKGAMGADFTAFKQKWGELMKAHALKNFKGTDGWAEGDEFHLELANSKMSHDDPRAVECLKEYIRLTRDLGKPENAKFERKHGDLLKPLLDQRTKDQNVKKSGLPMS